MSRSTFALFVGVFSAALNLIMILLCIGSTFFFVEAMSDDKETSEETMSIPRDVKEGIAVLFFVILGNFVFMFIASMLMVYGVQKEQHKYIAPWVFVNGLGVVINLIVIFVEMGKDSENDSELFYLVISAVCSAAIWFPVYSYYRSLKHPATSAMEACHISPATAPVAYAGASPVCPVASDYSHANAKYVPVVAPQQTHIMYPTMDACKA